MDERYGNDSWLVTVVEGLKDYVFHVDKNCSKEEAEELVKEWFTERDYGANFSVACINTERIKYDGNVGHLSGTILQREWQYE